MEAFEPKCPANCQQPGHHVHDDDWQGYWRRLTEDQQVRLRVTAEWEQIPLTEAAIRLAA